MANYTPKSGDVIVPGATGATELLSRVGGFIAGCGEASLAVVNGVVNGTPPSPAEVTGIIQDAISHGAGAGGVSTPTQLQATAKDYGFSLNSVPWQSALTQDAGVVPIVLGVGNATAFGGSDSNVHGHYITVVGRAQNGSYIVSDPNTAASVGGGFVTYSASQIAASLPFWAGAPGTVAQATQPATSAVASNTVGALNGVSQAIGTFGATLTADLTRGLQLVGWGVLALVIVGAGLWLLIPDNVKQGASDAVNQGTHAAVDAAVAASA